VLDFVARIRRAGAACRPSLPKIYADITDIHNLVEGDASRIRRIGSNGIGDFRFLIHFAVWTERLAAADFFDQ